MFHVQLNPELNPISYLPSSEVTTVSKVSNTYTSKIANIGQVFIGCQAPL